MQSAYNSTLQKLIAAKKSELQDEKRRLGLVRESEDEESPNLPVSQNNKSPQTSPKNKIYKEPGGQVATSPGQRRRHAINTEENTAQMSIEQKIELMKYIQYHSGLPGPHLKAGEYSPNNPLLRLAEGDGHDLFPGLGAYEERKKRLQRLRQQEYKEFLDKQSKKPTPKEDPPHRTEDPVENEVSRRQPDQCRPVQTQTSYRRTDAGTQCDVPSPTNIAVQTDGDEIAEISAKANPSLTQAERELSPRTVQELPQKSSADDRPIKPNLWNVPDTGCPFQKEKGRKSEDYGYRRRSYDNADMEQRQRSNREKLVRDLRHTYLPSFLDSDVIRQRNLKAEQEAAERRQFYQQELRNQIAEQQRIREERKAREKLLEAAEMRRLEEQLRMLRLAQQTEIGEHKKLSVAINESTADFDHRRNLLQRGIDQEKSFRSYSQPLNSVKTSKSDTSMKISKPPTYYNSTDDLRENRFSTNISDKSLFSPNYDLENYLRRNLNPKNYTFPDRLSYTRSEYVPSFLKKDINDLIVKDNRSQDSLPIPVLRHSPKGGNGEEVGNTDNGQNLGENSDSIERVESSEAMKKVESKWQVPIVQKNILRSLPSSNGKGKNILTQLGSIRRQLQLEQLKLDNMLGGSDATK